jgi:serine/threonine protein kinase
VESGHGLDRAGDPAALGLAACHGSPPPPPVYPGATVHNYIVEQLIGEGGMGAVWRVRQRMLKVPRAMKVLKPGTASVERFEEEMEMLAMVKHDNVVKVIDSGVLTDGSLFYVMEYVEGRSLEADIAKHRGRRPQWEYIREVILQICDGLAAIHDRGIIHRDMKPANCMLSPDVNETVHVKLVDLGVARRSSVVRLGSTSDGMFIGSAAYASPEQAAGETKTLTYGSDVYSVGIMLYELLTGIVPHVTDDPTDRAAMLRRRVIGTLPQPPSLHMRPGTLPPELDEILVRALQPDPRDRFQTVGELSAAIRQTPALLRPLRRLRPSQSLPHAPVDISDDDSTALFHSSQSSPGLPSLHPPATPTHASQSSSALRSLPPSQSASGARSLPPSQSASNLTPLSSQSSPGMAPVSAVAVDGSTLVATRPRRRPHRAAIVGGVLALVVGLLAIPGVRARVFGTADLSALVDEPEPPLFTRARAAIQRLGLQEAQDVQMALQQLADDPQPPRVVATARLLEAELVLMRALACQISVHLDPEPGSCRVHAQADPARAVDLLRQVPPDHSPAPQARVRALLRLVHGEPPADTPGLAPQDRDELRALASAAPLWRGGHAVPADLIPPLQQLKTPSTLVRSVLGLGLWRSGEDPQAARLLTATLKMADDQPAARAVYDALLRSHDGEPVPIHPPTPVEERTPPNPAPATPPGATEQPVRAPPRPPPPTPAPERFTSLDQQIDVGCARVRKGDRTGVLVLKDALSQGAVFETNFHLCFCLGEGFARNKTYDASLVWFIRALTIDPHHRDSLAGAANAAVNLGRTDRAVELYRRLRDIEPENPAASAYLRVHDPGEEPPPPLLPKLPAPPG